MRKLCRGGRGIAFSLCEKVRPSAGRPRAFARANAARWLYPCSPLRARQCFQGEFEPSIFDKAHERRPLDIEVTKRTPQRGALRYSV